ncbi:chromate transporter [Paenibacillus doosanensis]|uniref:chromate transporter n=1 Tax=Paenibacillus doosanensis TaxID=1229154 RepID=UPI00217F993F|nr:chromate transporter [Paenibacillus doosanensis]MCS7458863.1 chromate transporter [Paenibacillus doosanensis]
MLLALFWTFFKVGLVSFGGGYAILSVIEHEVLQHQWMTPEHFAEAVSLAGMSPGPIATNSAVLIGFKTSGMPGAVVSVIGMILPSFLIIIALAIFFYKKSNNGWMQAIFYGLKPMVAAMVIFAAYRVGAGGSTVLGINAHTAALVIIFAFAVIGTAKYRLHPLVVLSVSALMGTAFFY